VSRAPSCHPIPQVHEECTRPEEDDGTAAGTGASSATQPSVRRFVIIVHVQSDFAFRKYADSCSTSDLMLYRGLLLEVSRSPPAAGVWCIFEPPE